MRNNIHDYNKNINVITAWENLMLYVPILFECFLLDQHSAVVMQLVALLQLYHSKTFNKFCER